MFKGTKCLVTGGTGMIGRKVCELLVRQGAKVRSISLDNLYNITPGVINSHIDLSNFEECLKMMDGIDYVFHLAGVKGNPKVTKEKPASFLVPILQMNTNVLEACHLAKVKGVVYTSSKGVYEYETSYAGWAKMTGEKQIEAYRIQYGLENFHIVRLHNVFGEGDNFDPESAMVIPSLMAKMARGDKPIEVWGDGTDKRYFAYSGKVAEALLDAIEIRGDFDYKALELTISELVTCLSWLPYKIANPGKHDKYAHMFYNGDYPEFRFTDGDKAESYFRDSEESEEFERDLLETYRWFLAHREEYKVKKNYFKKDYFDES